MYTALARIDSLFACSIHTGARIYVCNIRMHTCTHTCVSCCIYKNKTLHTYITHQPTYVCHPQVRAQELYSVALHTVLNYISLGVCSVAALPAKPSSIRYPVTVISTDEYNGCVIRYLHTRLCR